MRCQRHLLCLLVQVWLKFCHGPESGCILGAEVLLYGSLPGRLWGSKSSRMRLRMIRERGLGLWLSATTTSVTTTNDHAPLDPKVGDYLFVPRAWMVRSMDCAWIAPGSVWHIGGQMGLAKMRGYCAILYCMCMDLCAYTMVACQVCRRSGFAHASGVGGGAEK